MVAQELRFVQVESNVALIDSRVYCRDVIQVNHADWLSDTLYKYQNEIESRLGAIRYETDEQVKTTHFDRNGNERVSVSPPIKYALLTEDQCNACLVLSKNLKKTIEAKLQLVTDFRQAKEMLRAQLERTLAASVAPEPTSSQKELERKYKQVYDKMQFFQAKSMGQDMLQRLQNHPDTFSEDGELVWQISGIADKYYFNSRCEEDLVYGEDYIRERKKLKLTPYAALKMILNFRSKRGTSARYLPEKVEVDIRKMTKPTTSGNKINRRAAQPQ